MQDLDVQMKDLDAFVSRAKSHNTGHHERHTGSVHQLTTTVEQSFANISDHFRQTFDRVQTLGDEMDAGADTLRAALDPLDDDVCRPLAELRHDIQRTALREYEPTGDTPQRTHYAFPTALPRTGAHEDLLAAMRDRSVVATPCAKTSPGQSPGPLVLPDISLTPVRSPASTDVEEGGAAGSALGMSLREVNPNLASATATMGAVGFESAAAAAAALVPVDGGGDTLPPLLSSRAGNTGNGNGNVAAGRPMRGSRLSAMANKKGGLLVGGGLAEGAENVPPPLRSSTRRKSPRMR